MISILIDENMAVEILMNRLKRFEDDPVSLALFEDYYTENVESFDGNRLDKMVDDFYIIDSMIIGEKELESNGIARDDYRVLAKNTSRGLYLVYMRD